MQNIPCRPPRAVMSVQLTEARAQDVTKTLLPSAALDGAADVTWGASLELQLRCLRRMQPANFKSMAAFTRWQVRVFGLWGQHCSLVKLDLLDHQA